MSFKEACAHFGLFWLRICMGAGMTYHGFGKVFGGKMDRFADGVGDMGFPEPLFFAWAASLSEFLGGILVVLGLGTRIAAFFIFCTMTVAAFIRHGADPLSVKELALAYWVMAGSLVFIGPGKWSLDATIKKS